MPTNFKKSYANSRQKVHNFKVRRPHRSFRLTKRRDYKRSLELPGLWAFTAQVNQTLWVQRKLFLLLALVYALATVALVGLGSQDTYSDLSTSLGETGQQVFEGDWSQIGQAGILFAAIATGGLSETPTQTQQIYAGILALLVWLTTVWLLRGILAGHKLKLRDGLYSAGAPIVATFLIVLVGVVQLLPLGLAIFGYYAAATSGVLAGGVAAMLFWFAASLLAILSLYWLTSTFLAAIIVTLPGMYPMKALRMAGDMVVSRRLRILLRVLWMFLCIVVAWAVVLIPFILVVTWLQDVWVWFASVPVIPVVLLALGTMTVVWAASYIYLLYRKIVDDDALPA